MVQAKFSITEEQSEFLNKHRKYGFKDKSEIVRTALAHFQRALHDEEMSRSAALYAELYDADLDSQAWVNDAAQDWAE